MADAIHSWLAAITFFSVSVLLVNADLPKGQRAIVTETSTANAFIIAIGDGTPKQYHIKSPPGEVSVRLYCHGACESSYNQLQVNDTVFIPDNGTLDIISGHHPEATTHERVSLPDCDPLTATFDKGPNIIVYILCHSGPQISNELTVFGVLQQSVSWSVTDPYTCFLNDAVMVDDVGMFFYGIDGEIYVAFASSAGLGVCSLKSDIPSFTNIPTSCPYIAKLSLFDPVNILVECTSGLDSQWVDAVWLFSIRDSTFTQRLPQQDYDVGQIVFSDNRLISATWRDVTVTLTNLSKRNPPSATVVAKGNVDSAHIVDTGSTSQLVVVAKGGVQQYDLHAVFGDSTKPKTLEGSEDVLTHFDDPSCPTAQVVDQCVIIPTRKGTTYGMALLPLNGDKPEVIPGVRPARFAVYPGMNIVNPTEPAVVNEALGGIYAIIGSVGGGVTMTVMILAVAVIAILIRIKNRRSASRPEQERGRDPRTVLIPSGAPPVRQDVSQLSRSANHNQDYIGVPQVDSDDEILEPEPAPIEPMEEVQREHGLISLVEPPPQGRPEGDRPDGQAD